MQPALVARTERIGYVEAWDEQRRLADLVRRGQINAAEARGKARSPENFPG